MAPKAPDAAERSGAASMIYMKTVQNTNPLCDIVFSFMSMKAYEHCESIKNIFILLTVKYEYERSF